jgi:hypothetical protein
VRRGVDGGQLEHLGLEVVQLVVGAATKDPERRGEHGAVMGVRVEPFVKEAGRRSAATTLTLAGDINARGAPTRDCEADNPVHQVPDEDPRRPVLCAAATRDAGWDEVAIAGHQAHCVGDHQKSHSAITRTRVDLSPWRSS